MTEKFYYGGYTELTPSQDNLQQLIGKYQTDLRYVGDVHYGGERYQKRRDEFRQELLDAISAGDIKIEDTIHAFSEEIRKHHIDHESARSGPDDD